MFTPTDIRNTTFNKGMRGYRVEDVNAFIEQISGELETILADKENTENKIYVLAEKVEEYRNDEDTLKTALINAQRMGENVIHEAKMKADVIIRDATAKAERIMEAAEARNQREELELARLKSEVTNFKAQVLEIYRAHIELLSRLPAEEDAREEPLPAENSAPAEDGLKEAAEAGLVEEPALIASEPAPAVFSTFEEVPAPEEDF